MRGNRNKRPLLDYLLPVCLKLEFKLVITPKISVELRPGNELKEIRVEAHLSQPSQPLLENHVKYCLDLVASYGIQERGDPFVEKAEKERKIRDDSASQSFHVMLLQDR